VVFGIGGIIIIATQSVWPVVIAATPAGILVVLGIIFDHRRRSTPRLVGMRGAIVVTGLGDLGAQDRRAHDRGRDARRTRWAVVDGAR
jgi:hypothetical protein